MNGPTQLSRLPKFLRMAVAGLLLAVGILFLVFAENHQDRADTDYISYWSSGRQLVHHQNPYDAKAVLQLERANGMHDSKPAFMRNPPTALFLALLLGYLSETTGYVVWSALFVLSLMLSVRLIWIMNGKRKDGLHLVAYFFPPVLACLSSGQMGTFILLGVVLFLFFHNRRPYMAGAALILCMMKPHLLVPFGVVLLLWTLKTRRYSVLTGAATALLSSLGLSLLFDKHVWQHYSAMMRHEQIQDLFIPVISTLLRVAIDTRATWLQFIPLALGCIWAVWFFHKYHAHWNWSTHGSLLLAVSVLVSPYAWFTDEVVVLPAVIGTLYSASQNNRSLLPFLIPAGTAFFEVVAGVTLGSGLYIWTPFAWVWWCASQPANAYGTCV